ncbi:MAG: energy-coupling factor ABC transporter ATP-binding protein [Megasphaera sp.]|jgi:energy-coupling factor transport system ATP-binding protein|uniref:energy-coupling factor ABC transporter ATP-binding protein n=1 Tax=Megasphaera sueciensis TaxID=349094 RepID=UPI003CFEBA33|nr:energy-coupling factor ABC transporter ATP-binding protein [Megasphaera sp.]MCI1822571.1 energy-coupling factor ABC transporter ATP-binding protein [Megasphaera sp.]
MEHIADISILEFHHRQGGQYRWITVSTLLLAIATILRLVSPSVAGFTPNWAIAMYCIAIHLTKPTYKQSFGIGMVYAFVGVLTSKAAFPYGDFISEPVAALLCCFAVKHLDIIKCKGHTVLPAFTGLICTIISGTIFLTTFKLALNIPDSVFFNVMLPAVCIIGLINGVTTPVLYYPAEKLFAMRGIIDVKSEEMEVSDHSRFKLSPLREGLISMEHLSYTYNKKSKPALDNISLSIHQGDFLVITGESGSGKSALCMAMSGAIPHYYGGVMKGMVFVDNKATTQVSIADLVCHVGMMLDDYDSQLVAMTVEEEIAFSLQNQGIAPNKIEEAIEHALTKVKLTAYRKREISKLSGGQRQRLVIAGVLATNPDILVFDQPTSALDPEGTRDFYQLLHDLNVNYKHTIIVVEHTLEAVLPYANRLILIQKGRIACDGDVVTTLRFMYENNIYATAVPQVFACQMTLEKAGCNVGDIAWLDLDTAINSLKQCCPNGGRIAC